MQKENIVIVPTYNERENIERLIRKVFSLEVFFDLLVVDDNSPDGTAQVVKELIKEYPDRLFLIERSGKLGLGTAYIEGFKWALQRDYKYIYEMDADFSHNPDDLIRLYIECQYNGYDVVIGSRYIQGVNVVNWPMSRVLLSYFASIYVRLMTSMKIKDPTAGFICYSRKFLESINLNKIRFIGYAFQIEMKYIAWKLSYKIKEIPIIFTDRTEGQSKMTKGIIREAFWGVIKLRFINVKKTYLKK